MENLMGELINAVAKLGIPTFWDFVPVLLSVAAVFVAIYVPSRIAKKQNQIAVFDKLYTAYSQFLLVRGFSTSIQTYAFTSNKHLSHWRTNFNEDDTLLCALDRIFDDATVFNIKGESFRGKNLETVALQTSRVKAPSSSEMPTP